MKSILVIDDDEDIHKILRNFLKNIYTIRNAMSGEEALQILSEGKDSKPDLILLDMEMPKMNGKAFKAKLNQSSDFKNIPVIYLSANNQYKDEVDLLMDFAFLNKPIEKEDLLSVLDSFFRLNDSN